MPRACPFPVSACLEGEVRIVKPAQETYTVKEFSVGRLDQITQAGASAIDLGIRGTDALHLVAAASARDVAALVDEYVFVTYNVRLARAARAAGVFTAVLE